MIAEIARSSIAASARGVMIFVIERSQGGGAHANLSEPKMNEGRRVKARAEEAKGRRMECSIFPDRTGAVRGIFQRLREFFCEAGIVAADAMLAPFPRSIECAGCDAHGSAALF